MVKGAQETRGAHSREELKCALQIEGAGASLEHGGPGLRGGGSTCQIMPGVLLTNKRLEAEQMQTVEDFSWQTRKECLVQKLTWAAV